MPFNYYPRLSRRKKAIYNESDAVSVLEIPNAQALRDLVPPLVKALAADERKAVQVAARALGNAVLEALGAPAVRLAVLARRPKNDSSELHGIYVRSEGEKAEIQIWMRTAERGQAVKPRTFIRTLLHELCHHLDYEVLRLGDSFHTTGFYQRESSLVRQLLPPAPPRARVEVAAGQKVKKTAQLELPWG